MQYLAMLPMFNQRQERPPAQHPDRVDVAIRVLNDLTQKTMPRVAVNDMAIEEVSIPELTIHEKSLQQVCCQTLQDYLKGNLIPDVWEQQALVEGRKGSGGTLLACFRCYSSGNKPRSGCMLCKGTGNLIVLPSFVTDDSRDLGEAEGEREAP